MATTWITLTSCDLAKKLTEPELEAIGTFHTAAGQLSPIDETISGVVSEVRGYIEGCAKNILNSDATTIPDQLSEAALAIIRARVADRLPDCGILITDGRHREMEEALRLLRDVAVCKFGRFDAGSDTSTTIDESDSGFVTGGNARACIGGDAKIEF